MKWVLLGNLIGLVLMVPLLSFLLRSANINKPLDQTVKVVAIHKVKTPIGTFIQSQQGTGLRIGKAILTDAHVVGSPQSLEAVYIFDHRWINLKKTSLMVGDNKRDFAILKDEQSSTGVEFDNFKFGEKLHLIGNPISGDLVETDTKVIGLDSVVLPTGHERQMIMVDGSHIRPGFSGGGLFNQAGKVVGTVELCDGDRSAAVEEGRKCWAITSQEIVNYLRE
jgi:S1-C subfamily serine protease